MFCYNLAALLGVKLPGNSFLFADFGPKCANLLSIFDFFLKSVTLQFYILRKTKIIFFWRLKFRIGAKRGVSFK